MSKHRILYFQDNIQITLEERNNKVRGKFRHLARQVSREVFDVPEENLILFAYEKQTHVGQMSFSLPDMSLTDPGVTFDSEYYPQISFMFVLKDFQSMGFGRLMLNQALKMIAEVCSMRPVRLQSAIDAVPFFQKCGFQIVSQPIQCFHSGSRLFKTLVNMELEIQSTKGDNT
ncbi:uncharacterized protein LOC132716711 [Ruditapes philippinarum]|uniref:uncharacterized protein LOC132716711 n=1 Tax=Ruditapes philippinarum TaxID=129788 RepID=UPI00295BC464|nr:uncharacterized protein LOC132716711 [Ruditapes philippinarum]